MAQQLKAIEIWGKGFDGTFKLERSWLEIYLTAGITLNNPLIIEYTKMGEFYDNSPYNEFWAQVSSKKAAFCKKASDTNSQSYFGVTLYPDFTMIFSSDSERNAFIKDLEGLVKKAGYPDFKIV
ncbi:MAG: hypothetical protein J5974_09225 [Pyramidobacter sp.]|nr:hypothetical protein [Pyramidobacter sp.]